MKASGAPRRVWRAVRWPLLGVVILFVAYVAYGMVLVYQRDKDDAAVAAIHAQKLTLADVQGVNLPPVPNQIENDATVAGIDKNNNGIRDDVELAIFKKYPGTANQMIRAAELQYAIAEQRFYSNVPDEVVFRAILEESSRADECVIKLFPRPDLGTVSGAEGEYYVKHQLPIDVAKIDAITKEVDNLVFNSDLRKTAKENAYNFMTSYGTASGPVCDVTF